MDTQINNFQIYGIILCISFFSMRSESKSVLKYETGRESCKCSFHIDNQKHETWLSQIIMPMTQISNCSIYIWVKFRIWGNLIQSTHIIYIVIYVSSNSWNQIIMSMVKKPYLNPGSHLYQGPLEIDFPSSVELNGRTVLCEPTPVDHECEWKDEPHFACHNVK